MKNRMRLILLALTGGVMLLSAPVMAVDVPIKITGTVRIPPCTITTTDLHVPFKKVALQEVDGLAYSVTKTINFNCEYFDGTPYISVTGEQLGGSGNNVLATKGSNPSALGIALYQGRGVDPSHPLKIGPGEQNKFGFPITKGLSGKNASSGSFTFTAVPYKRKGYALIPGGFSAVATMNIYYL